MRNRAAFLDCNISHDAAKTKGIIFLLHKMWFTFTVYHVKLPKYEKNRVLGVYSQHNRNKKNKRTTIPDIVSLLFVVVVSWS